MSGNNNVGGDKPRKSLILNAFVEMCTFPTVPCLINYNQHI